MAAGGSTGAVGTAALTGTFGAAGGAAAASAAGAGRGRGVSGGGSNFSICEGFLLWL